MPELSSIKLTKKLYSTRPSNNKSDLQQQISGATKDINDISNLLLSFNKYRAGAVASLKSAAMDMKNATANTDGPKIEQGILGRMPETVTSIAELMVHDSDVNVYEDKKVTVASAAEFNIRGQVTKVLNKKEKDKAEQKIAHNLKKQQIAKENAKKIQELKKDTVPTIGGSERHDVRSKRIYNEYEFVPAAVKHTEKVLGDNLSDSEDEVADFDNYEQRNAQQDQERKEARDQELMEEDPEAY